MAPKVKKSLKANVGNVSTSFLRFVNMVLIVGGIVTIVLIFVIKPSPTWTGWGFIGLGVFVILSGIFGTISSGQTGCFTCHMALLFISWAGLVTSFMLIFLEFNTILSELSPAVSYYDAQQYLRAIGASYFSLSACQLVILLLACMIQVCGFLEYYEDLDAIAASREVARMHQEDEVRRNKIAPDSGSFSSGHKLVEKMKAKYAQWTRKGAAKELDNDLEAEKLETTGSKSHLYTS